MPVVQEIRPAGSSDTEARSDTWMKRIVTALETMAGIEDDDDQSDSAHAKYRKRVQEYMTSAPLAPLFQDASITDILINGAAEIFVGRGALIEKTDLKFASERELYRFARAICNSVGRPLTDKRPLVDARLEDGSRVNIIAPPMAVDGLSMSIRKFAKQGISLDDMVQQGVMPPEVAELLKVCARERVSILVSGGTGTGKTTLLNAISAHISNDERIVTIEDTAELRLQQPHVVRLETKEPSTPGDRTEEVNASDLVRNALRMRPHRIIVGEVRGREAYDMIQAMNTGHDGSMTTVHANNPREAVIRIDNFLESVMANTPPASVRRQIVNAITMIVQIGFTTDNKRAITSVTELVGMEGDTPTSQELFTLRGTSPIAQWTGLIPRNERLIAARDTKQWADMFGGQQALQAAQATPQTEDSLMARLFNPAPPAN